MKLAGLVGCAVLAVTGVGAAHAQSAACTQVPALMASNHAQVRGLQGAVKKDEADEVTYVAKTQVAGFKSCTLESAKTIDSISDYWEHHLWCEGEAATSEAANQLVEALWACTKDSYSERAASEAWIGGRYRMIGFDAETPAGGKSAGLVDFGTTEYARIDLEKAYDESDEFNLHIYWMFTK